MPIIKFIHSVRKRPANERRFFALVSSGLLTAGLLASWLALDSSATLFSLPTRSNGHLEAAKARENVASPIHAVSEGFSSIISEGRERVSSIAEIVTETKEVFENQTEESTPVVDLEAIDSSASSVLSGAEEALFDDDSAVEEYDLPEPGFLGDVHSSLENSMPEANALAPQDAHDHPSHAH